MRLNIIRMQTSYDEFKYENLYLYMYTLSAKDVFEYCIIIIIIRRLTYTNLWMYIYIYFQMHFLLRTTVRRRYPC